jgi:hypothetical protein
MNVNDLVQDTSQRRGYPTCYRVKRIEGDRALCQACRPMGQWANAFFLLARGNTPRDLSRHGKPNTLEILVTRTSPSHDFPYCEEPSP